eukprot:TRINITY_DN8094_c0_g1_i1.p2 TRINITY_DN8094_c0_g1~~TRINITY_DN8094_c0_g1_i1.p2  ORF type:complete len:298 (+),score=100.69 TRINITY_DN8094_c0_g1_i1:62-955(+)
MECPLPVTPGLQHVGKGLSLLGLAATVAVPQGAVLVGLGRVGQGVAVLAPMLTLLVVAAYYIKLQKGGLRQGGWSTWAVARLTLWPTVAWNYFRHLLGERMYYDEVRPGVFVGGAPFHLIASELVLKHKVRAVVNCCEEYAGTEALYEKMGVRQFRLRCLDFCDVPLDKIIASVDYLCEEVAGASADGAPPPVYIHCKSGKGRAVTVATAYLAKQYHAGNTQAANAEIKKARPTAFANVYQRPAMRDFASQHLGHPVDREDIADRVVSPRNNVERRPGGSPQLTALVREGSKGNLKG